MAYVHIGMIVIMDGTNCDTGKPLGGIGHLKQSITKILTTPIGSRVRRRTFGSRIYEILDAPINAGTVVDMYAATAEALANWEPRFQLTQVYLSNASSGSMELSLTGVYLPDGRTITLDGIKVQ